MKYFTIYFFWWLRSLRGIEQQTTFLLYLEINRNIFATLSEAIEEIERSNFLICYLEVISNHNQDLVLLPQNNDPYAYNEEVRDDNIGLVANLDLPANFTGEVELHQHNSQSEDEKKKMQENKKGNKRKWKDRTRALENDWIGEESRNHIETFPQILDIGETEL